MKRINICAFIIVVILTILSNGCMPNDPLPGDLVTRNIYPGSAETYSLGSLDLPFKSIFVSGGSIYIGGQKLDIEGLEGIPGSQWYYGSDTPSDGVGIDGDYYLNTANGDIYNKSSRIWSIIGNITGPAGAVGPAGPQGQQGIQGQTGTTGATGPKGDTGDTGDIGPQGTTGEQGAQGPTGPNQVTTSTDTDITGLLKGNGSTVSQAIADTDYSLPYANKTILEAITEAFTTALKTSYDWLVANITSAWKTTVDNFVASKGIASGLAPLDANSKVPTMNLGGSGASSSTYLRGDQIWATPGGTPVQYNQSVTLQSGFAVDTYLTGSDIVIPNNSLKVGSRYHLIFDVSKTALGTATPIIYVRFGTNGSTADTARLTFTFLNQTAAADIGTFEVWVIFRTIGSGTSAVIQGSARCTHRLQITGLQNLPSPTLQVTSSGFDSTIANSKIGVSVNGGSSAAWTIKLVQAELSNLQ
jgi:hypothetical protein